MLKRGLALYLIFTACTFSVAANALQINLSFANDFIANKDKLNISIDLFHGSFPNVQESHVDFNGIDFDKTNLFAQRLSSLYNNIQPIKDQASGRDSIISLGMINNNGSVISPASCQNINLNNKTYLNILLSESGCTFN